jgi:hypothetical protein
MRDIRLGDDIDDYCVRCKRVMNHAVVSVINAAPAKVRCRTCHSDHDFRHEQPPPPKVDPRKAALFNEVLKKVKPGDGQGEAVIETEDVLEGVPVEVEVEVEADPEIGGVDGDEASAEIEPEVEPEAEPEPAPAKPASKGKAKTAAVKTKAKPKAKGRK